MPTPPLRIHPFDLMRSGYEILLDALAAHGFEAHEPRWQHPGDDDVALAAYVEGANRALGEIARGDTVVELVVDGRLRPPTYRIGGVRLQHGALMRAGGAAETTYPTAAADPLADFRAVAADLRRHGSALLGG